MLRRRTRKDRALPLPQRERRRYNTRTDCLSSINSEGGEITQRDAKTYKIGRDHNVSESEEHDHKHDDTCGDSDTEKEDNTERSGDNNADDNNCSKNNGKDDNNDETMMMTNHTIKNSQEIMMI